MKKLHNSIGCSMMLIIKIATVFVVGFMSTHFVNAEIQCDAPNLTKSTANCGGILYDFSTLRNNTPIWLSGSRPGDDYTYYFQMVNGGLPSDNSIPGCHWNNPSYTTGNAVGQGGLNDNSCYALGSVNQQSWTLYNETSPQYMEITFSGGDQGRSAIIRVTCNSSVTRVPTFQAVGEVIPLTYGINLQHASACQPAPPSPPPPGPITCSDISVTDSTANCGGTIYDLSGLRNNTPIWLSGSNGEDYNFFFQMVNGGLPSDNSMPGCHWNNPSYMKRNAIGQGSTFDDSCYAVGSVDQQQWTLHNEASPQYIEMQFLGGDGGRTGSIQVTCNSTVTGVPTFLVQGEIIPLVYQINLQHASACAKRNEDSSSSRLTKLKSKLKVATF